MKVDASKLYNLYLGIVSFVAIVAIWINLWIVLTSVWKYFLITDEEYLQNVEYYKLEQCERWVFQPDTQDYAKKSEEEVESCKQKVKDNVSISRSYDLKEMFISSWAWFVVFLLFFLFHYPKFLKQRK